MPKLSLRDVMVVRIFGSVFGIKWIIEPYKSHIKGNKQPIITHIRHAFDGIKNVVIRLEKRGYVAKTMTSMAQPNKAHAIQFFDIESAKYISTIARQICTGFLI